MLIINCMSECMGFLGIMTFILVKPIRVSAPRDTIYLSLYTVDEFVGLSVALHIVLSPIRLRWETSNLPAKKKLTTRTLILVISFHPSWGILSLYFGRRSANDLSIWSATSEQASGHFHTRFRPCFFSHTFERWYLSRKVGDSYFLCSFLLSLFLRRGAPLTSPACYG